MQEDEDEDEETSTSRYPTLPSLIALQQMRNRLCMAHDGRRLMKWSASATGRELIKVAGQLITAYESFGEDVGEAFMLLARCRYFYHNMNKMVLEMNQPKACVTVGRTTKNVAGCRSTKYHTEENCSDSFPCLGIDKGGEAIMEAKQVWRKMVLRMVNIGQLRKNFHALDECHQAANKKANVLGRVIIPRTTKTIRYILSELDEAEREEFFRLKKVLQVKYKNKKKNNPGDGENPPETDKEEKKVRLPPGPSPNTKSPKTKGSGTQKTPTASEVTLGVFETEEITEVIQVFNPDGTVSEKRREVKIKRKLEDTSSQNNKQGGSGSSSFKDRKNVGLVSIIYPKKSKETQKVVDKTVTGLPIINPMIRDCVSSIFDLGFDDILESSTEIAPTPKDDVSLDSRPSITDSGRTTNSSEYTSTNSFGDDTSTQEVKDGGDDSVTDFEVTNDK